MKKTKTKQLLAIVFLFLIINSCSKSSITFNTQNTTYEENGEIEQGEITTVEDIVVPDEIIPEISEDDPQQSGIPCTDTGYNGYNPENVGKLMDVIEIPDLPENYDLSDLMPPVRSQGQQGSCTAWATTYYLKSYQEKVQYEYEYSSFENVMSPSFIYNQIASDCDSGSAIAAAFELLKESGVPSWKDFPYSDQICSLLPDEQVLELAKEHKIEDWYGVGVPNDNTDENYTITNIVKTLIHQGTPPVIAIYISRLNFQNVNGKFLATTYFKDPNDDNCGHAMLIVGYDDTVKAFKVINSWGTDWGDNGYCWISYDFFPGKNNEIKQKGLRSIYVAYDEDIETTDGAE